jgi:thioester reductase-like protein
MLALIEDIGSSMTYFVTGATGFIGRHLLERLLMRKGAIHCLVRKESLAKFNTLRAELGAGQDRLVAVVGNLDRPRLGVTSAVARALDGKIRHFFHLAAIYDLAADADSQATRISTVRGMRWSWPMPSRPAAFTTAVR